MFVSLIVTSLLLPLRKCSKRKEGSKRKRKGRREGGREEEWTEEATEIPWWKMGVEKQMKPSWNKANIQPSRCLLEKIHNFFKTRRSDWEQITFSHSSFKLPDVVLRCCHENHWDAGSLVWSAQVRRGAEVEGRTTDEETAWSQLVPSRSTTESSSYIERGSGILCT